MDKDVQISLLRNMQRIRSMEELCAELYTKEKIRGFLHLYSGEEAVATGVISLLRPADNVCGTYREHAHILLKGLSSKIIMAEMFGKIDGCSKGRGGSMHLYSVEKRFFGGNAIVGAGIPQALGLAFAAKKLNEDRHTVAFFGDGASAEGVFHESMNMACLWKIPLLFCCENNYYAMGTALKRYQSQTDLVAKARSYLMEADSVDGMNIFEVVEKTKMALEYIKNEKKPFFLEFKTYRFRSHSMYDPDLYRDKQEIAKWKERCPIEFLKNKMLENNFISLGQWEQIQKEINEEMQAAVLFAEQSPVPDPLDWNKYLYQDILCK